MDPVGRGDGTASSLSPLMFIQRQTATEVCPEKSQIKERRQKTPSRSGAQRDEPNGAERDGDGEMRRDTGLAVGGDRRCLPSYSPFSVVFTSRCRLLPPFLSLSLSRSLHDASPSLPSSVLRSAPGVTPFPLVRK